MDGQYCIDIGRECSEFRAGFLAGGNRGLFASANDDRSRIVNSPFVPLGIQMNKLFFDPGTDPPLLCCR